MYVSARLYGDLKKFANEKNPPAWKGAVNEGTTVQQLIRIIGCPDNKVIGVIKNGIYVQKGELLTNGDVLNLLTSLGGG